MLKAIILEDEINGLENLKNLLSLNCPHVKVVGEGGSIKERMTKIQAVPLRSRFIHLPATSREARRAVTFVNGGFSSSPTSM